ncbi:hypothetical protein SAMN05216480_109138 [Pustulibacterium marinum]|uniref:DNA-binding transcriptional regulator GbsR, MarR family n=1 Tax=Pustulibacterium marinum TaxID=1224947 RepID=A0A1I7HJC1_9FLAO|nr:transcriptional regulator [Pustulibacterium marinum]SFU60761.1 hypothetical protein SAMN05216480_109138 [Pustulibacterium marinum]
MQKDDLIEEKKLLVEEMGVYFETCDTLSPLSSRIFAYLALSLDEGVSFEELQEALEASKSSISTNLQLLQSMRRIGYFTKPGDRKRYFKIDDEQIINRLDDKIETWKHEKKIHQKVLCYKKRIFQDVEIDSENLLRIQYNEHYITFVDSMIQNLEKLKENLIQLK